MSRYDVTLTVPKVEVTYACVKDDGSVSVDMEVDLTEILNEIPVQDILQAIGYDACKEYVDGES